MSGGEDRPNHSNDNVPEENVPEFGDLMQPSENSPEEEKLDLEALLSDIKRVPTTKQAASPAKPDTPASNAPRPVRAQAGSPAPARRNPAAAAAAAKRRKQIEAKRRQVKIMMAVTAVLLVAAIGTGVYYLVSTLSKDKKTTDTTTTVAVSSSSEDSVAVAVSETTPEQTETTTVPPTPTPDVTPFPAGGPDLSGYCVVIDAGHQAVPNREQEEMSSSMSGSKDKSAKGYNGVVTGTDESEINLETALLLRAYLESLGCEVYITRETNDVDISNKERAEFAVSYDPDVYIRLFCNCANDSKTSGCSVIVPSTGKYADEVAAWGEKLGEFIAESCGANFNGCRSSGNYTGLNWANSIPSFMVRMGYLSNSDDEANLLSESYQYQICEGIAQFIATMPKR